MRPRSNEPLACLPKRSSALVIVTLLLAVASCGSEVPDLAERPFGVCACQAAGATSCPVDVCDLRLEIEASTCKGLVNQVEIQIGAELEKQFWVPGQPSRTCATVKRGESFEVVARADTAWRWSPTIPCPAQTDPSATEGTTVSRVLQCIPAGEK